MSTKKHKQVDSALSRPKKWSWIDERSAEESLEILRALSRKCALLGGALARELDSYAQDNYQHLMSYDISYDTVLSASDGSITDVIYSRQILALFQKSQFLEFSPGWDRGRMAAERFIEAERMCRDTNRRLRSSYSDPSIVGSDVSSVLYIAQQKISSILGRLPGLGDLPFSFGPGANTNVKGSHSSPRLKLGARLECSSNMSPTVHEFLYETPEWAALHDLKVSKDTYIVDVDVVPGKVMFVPKNAKTDRSICVEPLLNSFFQKGVGVYIRDRLALVNVDLRDQTRNQKMACFGSTHGTLATVDLSMASDCIARELVWNLLPYGWAEFLDKLRTGTVRLPKAVDQEMIADYGMIGIIEPDKPYTLEKFSSMGNGYTFELETLIFYGIAFACVKHLDRDADVNQVSVYGDDIIIPVSAFELLKRVLSFCGFTFNESKSFSTTGFRESCGADYLFGFDIRPFYQKTLISDRTLYTMHNWFIRHGEYELAAIALQYCNPDNLLFGPDGFGDGHLIGSHTLRQSRAVKRAGWGGGYFDSYALSERRYTKASPGDAVLPSYSVYTRSGEKSPTDPDVVRGSNGYTKISIYTLGSSIFSRKV